MYRSGVSQNPYNFTPFELDSFIVDTNGDAQQLIATILQLSSFYISNDTIVFLLKQSYTDIYGDFVTFPLATEILAVGEQVYFGPRYAGSTDTRGHHRDYSYNKRGRTRRDTVSIH